MPDSPKPIRVLFSCSGIGNVNRGIESFFREAFDGLRTVDGLDLLLLKGAGVERAGEHVLWSLPRTGRIAIWFGKLAGRNGYVVEQWSTFFSVTRHIRKFQPHVIFYSDANLGFRLYWRRRQIAVSYRLLFSNGAPVHPPFVRTDFVHQVAPCYFSEALLAGEPAEKHFLVPYGIRLSAPPQPLSQEDRIALRQRLGLPGRRKVVLSVGWIRSTHKRMDYVIEETARLPQPRPFLQLLGAMDEGSGEIIDLGRRLLGPDGFAAFSVPYERVFDYYRAADCFVLASLNEGFGRVYIEALMHGLPVITHRHPVTEFVLRANAVLADLTKPGALSPLLAAELHHPPGTALMQRRWAAVRDRFSWPVLAPSYLEMFRLCAA